MTRSFDNAIRRFYKLYTSGLSLREIEGLIKRDAPGIGSAQHGAGEGDPAQPEQPA